VPDSIPRVLKKGTSPWPSGKCIRFSAGRSGDSGPGLTTRPCEFVL